MLPDAAKGKVTLAALGFTYASRFAVEEWGAWFKKQFGGRADVAFFEVPMMGRAARLGRFFIDRGMRKNTPKEAHDHVITVYGDTSAWKKRVGFTAARENDAYLMLVGPDGVIRWKYQWPLRRGAGRRAEGGRGGVIGTVGARHASPLRDRVCDDGGTNG